MNQQRPRFPRVSLPRTVLFTVGSWLIIISVLHDRLNLGGASVAAPAGEQQLVLTKKADVDLGRGDGTALVVHKSSDIHRIEDLRGRRVAVPGRDSNQFLLLDKALRDHGVSLGEITLVEMPPPDMPAALSARAVDAITSGEPVMGQVGQAELDGYGRVLYLTKER